MANTKKRLIIVLSSIATVLVCTLLFIQGINNSNNDSVTNENSAISHMTQVSDPVHKNNNETLFPLNTIKEESKHESSVSGPFETKRDIQPSTAILYTGPDADDTFDYTDYNNLSITDNHPNNAEDVFYLVEGDTLHISSYQYHGEVEYTKNNQESGENPGWYSDIAKIKSVIIEVNQDAPSLKPICTKSWFSTCTGVGTYNAPIIEKFNGLKDIDLSNTQDTSYMFAGVGHEVNNIVLNNTWESISCPWLMFACGMFANTDKMNCGFGNNPVVLKDLYSVSNMPNFQFMFQGCKDLNLGCIQGETGWDAVCDTSYMFNKSGLDSIGPEKGFTNLDLSQCSNMRSMFNNCPSLTKIDFSKAKGTPENETNMINMFRASNKLKTIIVPAETDWGSLTEPNDYFMFKDCNALVGGAGTTYSDANVGKSYAKVDGGQSAPGYFTGPSEPIDWQPMQATSGDSQHPEVNFYPAFSSASEVEGYKFAVKSGNKYQEIENSQEHPITMAVIYSALSNAQISDSKTLYYFKTDSTKGALKCYTVIDKAWQDVFVNVGTGKSNDYVEVFKNNYINHGIYTAELGMNADETFGKYWDANSSGAPTNLPTVNTVSYTDFYNGYGKSNGGLLSTNSYFAMGIYIASGNTSFRFYVDNGQWSDFSYLSSPYGLVLAKEFGVPPTHTVSAVVDEGHGTITGGPFNVPDGTPYIVNNANKKIVIGSEGDKVIQYTDGEDYTLDKWMIGEEAAESGIVTGDITFKAQTKQKPVLKSLNIDGVRYFPVVTKFQGVKFYNGSQQEIIPAASTGYEVSDLKNAQYYSGDAPFKAVRSINNISFDTLYPEQAKSGGVKEFDYNSVWAKSNLKYYGDKALETVEGLVNARQELDDPPKIEGVSLTDIWKSYNPSTGFGGEKGLFWSCVAIDNVEAWLWYSHFGESGGWHISDRDIVRDMCVCVSRAFNYVPTVHKVSAEVEKSHGTITGGPFDVPEGTPYTVDNANKKIVIGSEGDKVIQYSDGDSWVFDKWMIGEEEAPASGTITSDITFKAQTKEKPVLKSLDIDNVHYFPVVTKFQGVTFYDESQQKIIPAVSTGYEVSDLKNAQYYSGDAPFKAVRSINKISFDALYQEETKKKGVKDFNYNSDWAKSNLKYDGDEPLETVEGLVNASKVLETPAKIDDVSLTDIWKSYNPAPAQETGFGGIYGYFWSCVAIDGRYAYRWNSLTGESGNWNTIARASDTNMCVCVSRAFN